MTSHGDNDIACKHRKALFYCLLKSLCKKKTDSALKSKNDINRVDK